MKKEPIEAECKFRIEQVDALKVRLEEIRAHLVREEKHRDTYLRHPARDFRATDEALRIREIDGAPFVTYKGPRREGPIKIRPEIELPLVEGTVEQWIQIWSHLGFETVLAIEKSRIVYFLDYGGQATTITIDHVQGLGDFAEIERVLEDDSDLPKAEQDILSLAAELGLTHVEKKSYLGMLLQKGMHIANAP